MPGGGVEAGETLQEAAAREAIEEIGLEIRPPQDYFYVYHYEDKDLYVYGIISETSNTNVALSEAHTEFKWISKDEYKNFEYTPSVGSTIKEFFEKEINNIITSMNYKGIIIEESLGNKDVLKKVKILSTKVEPVAEKHKTPWIKQWTLHTVEIVEDKAEGVAEEISKALESEHNWYADFKNKVTHFIIFKNKVFKVGRTRKEQYDEAKEYGISLGIPPHQVDFYPEVEEWKR